MSTEPSSSPATDRTRLRLALVLAIVAVALASVVSALVVVSLTRPSDAEVRRQVATDLGVPSGAVDLTELPVVQRLVDRATEDARRSIVDQLDTSLALGAATGVATALALAVLIVVVWRPDLRRSDGTAGDER